MSEITDEAYSEAMDEIERLQIQLGAASASNQFACGQRDKAFAEIERLKEETDRLRVAYQSSQANVIKYWEQRTSDHKLIAELADALRSRIPWAWREKDQPHMELIGRARTSVEPEAVK